MIWRRTFQLRLPYIPPYSPISLPITVQSPTVRPLDSASPSEMYEISAFQRDAVAQSAHAFS